MSEHGTSSGHVAGKATAGADGDSPIELSSEPFDVTPVPDDSDAPATRRPRTRIIVLASLLAVGLAGAAVLGTAAWRISSQRDTTLGTPDRVAGLTMDTSENATTTSEYLRTALAAEVDLDNAVGAVYADPGARNRSVLFFGGTTLIWTPGSDLETAFELMSDETGAIAGLHDVDAGEFGGTMKCGTTASPDGDIAVCGWADHGSLALAMFPNRTAAESAPLLRDIRDAVQTRN
jgi:hypothetical protein